MSDKKFGSIADAAAQTTQHMETARGMVKRGEFWDAVGYLASCGWHKETAERYLKPDPRDRFSAI